MMKCLFTYIFCYNCLAKVDDHLGWKRGFTQDSNQEMNGYSDKILAIGTWSE